MYEALLQSADRPFRATPDTKFYFPSDSIEQARQTVVRAILRAEGPCLVLGGAGLGKTMLCQVIANDVYGRFDIVKLHASGLCSRRALLQSILFELQLPYRGLSEGELRMSIMDRLSPSPETAPSGILLLVDEAHTLSPKLLEELRLITNFARNGQPRARLVLIGNMRLEDTFAHPQMDSFNQRLAARCYLQPMTRDQTLEFVRHQLRTVQIEPGTIVTNDALRTLFAASEGVPRLVNQLMDHALVLGIAAGQCPISASMIEEAWSDLQQLPAPWHSSNAPDKSTAPAAQIEFGELRDEDDDTFSESTAAAIDAPSPFVKAITAPTIPIADTRYSDDVDDEAMYQLAADDEPIDVITRGPKQNFFAAFEPIGIQASIAEDDEDDSDISPDDQLVSEITGSDSLPSQDRVVFDASKAFGFNRHQTTFPRGTEPLAQASPFVAQTSRLEPKVEVTISPLPSNFFGSYTSDADILDIDDGAEGLADSYDVHSVWENDPPIREPRRESIQPAPRTLTIDENKLFGEDFEEEISIVNANKVSAGKERRIFEPRPVETAAEMPLAARHAAAEEQLAAMESQHAEPEDARPYEDAEQAKRFATASSKKNNLDGFADIASSWTVDVAATESEREIALHTEIEDLVSQLNFSAFAIEPYSVEQIEIDYERSVPTSKQAQTVRDEERETIYTLHTSATTEMDDDIHSNLSLDDDRDLLVIEEELPVSNRMTAEQLDAPIVKATGYSQLFAKLRH
ncbi:MAG: AAA family ATPase [Pirellulaceae bacterium]|nr:AAA family ATPase [Pirellulaceae bacterium]